MSGSSASSTAALLAAPPSPLERLLASLGTPLSAISVEQGTCSTDQNDPTKLRVLPDYFDTAEPASLRTSFRLAADVTLLGWVCRSGPSDRHGQSDSFFDGG